MPTQNNDKRLLAAIAARLRQAREGAALKQDEVATSIGIARIQTIGDWESGAVNVGSAQLAALCRIYGVSSDWVLGLSVLPTFKSSGTIINSAVERAVLSARSRVEADKMVRKLRAGTLTELRLAFRIPPEHEVLDDAAWVERRRVLDAKIRRLTTHGEDAPSRGLAD